MYLNLDFSLGQAQKPLGEAADRRVLPALSTPGQVSAPAIAQKKSRNRAEGGFVLLLAESSRSSSLDAALAGSRASVFFPRRPGTATLHQSLSFISSWEALTGLRGVQLSHSWRGKGKNARGIQLHSPQRVHSPLSAGPWWGEHGLLFLFASPAFTPAELGFMDELLL